MLQPETWYTIAIDPAADWDLESSLDLTDVKYVEIQSEGWLAAGSTFWIDTLETATPVTTTPYSAAIGALIEKPVDVVRHVLEKRLGQTIDETSFATALTNLGTDKLALDLRALGFDAAEVLAGLWLPRPGQPGARRGGQRHGVEDAHGGERLRVPPPRPAPSPSGLRVASPRQAETWRSSGLASWATTRRTLRSMWVIPSTGRWPSPTRRRATCPGRPRRI